MHAVRWVVGCCLLLVACGGCDPLSEAVIDRFLDEVSEETENFELVNQPDNFYRKADHHGYKGVEVYTWTNCGERALVDGQVRPSCPNDVFLSIFDAEGTLVFQNHYCAPDCDNGVIDWPADVTMVGVPGDWRIEMGFDLDMVEDLEFRITREGPPVVVVTGTGIGEGDPGSDDDYVRWESVCTDDREVVEEHPLPVTGDDATVEITCDDVSGGEMEIEIDDDAGVTVHQERIQPGGPTTTVSTTAKGKPGAWKVRIRSVHLTSSGLVVNVRSPRPTP